MWNVKKKIVEYTYLEKKTGIKYPDKVLYKYFKKNFIQVILFSNITYLLLYYLVDG